MGSSLQVRRRTYTVIYNDQLTPGQLSARAWGIYAYLVGRPPGWEARSAHLCMVFTEGRDAIRKALRELEAAGLLRREYRYERGLRRTCLVLEPDSARDGFSGPGGSGPSNYGESNY
jgi:hypothetical protein